ncbi:IS66 family insertion sequence element accessory protein TnpB [Parabacteroides sp. ZJ-118]|uniref:IS66 family insertion sequence element accessory protein TnpB n=1 Tax=Parabacteroides sp. ZJ-118 TaxID=2709398 RepID=UPI0013EDFDCC|nr:IS66 family insertion sequence element accessory protein TnpB [Parabacteroides sp. ZJ-118]
MLNLSATFKYYICTDEVTLRYRHKGLREYIKSKLHKDPANGDVYIFLSRDFKRMRVYYHNHGGAILTEKVLFSRRFVTPLFEDATKHVYHISWEDFVYIMEGVIRLDKHEYFDEVDEDEVDEDGKYEDETADDRDGSEHVLFKQ